MNKWLGVSGFVLGFAFSVLPQDTTNQSGAYHPTQEEIIAANKRRAEQLRHPTFISLRLTSRRRDVPREEPSTTPSPYSVGDAINFQLLITQSLTENLMLGNLMSPYYEYRPELYKDANLLPYNKQMQEKIARAESRAPSGSLIMVQLAPGRETRWTDIDVEYWYGALAPGHYQLIVRKQFAYQGDWAESNPITFDVIPRKQPTLIPDGLSVRLVPVTSKPSPDGQYRLAYDEVIAVELINESDQRVQVDVIDRYYGHRPQLIKDGKLIPYSDETAKLVEAKDKNPRSVEVSPNLLLDPKTSSRLDGFSLKQWYPTLSPGIYRLTDRRRFEIDGPWTKDSRELVFEIVP
jgi:hypothetical protein